MPTHNTYHFICYTYEEMFETFIDKDQNYKLDDLSFSNQLTTPYFQRNQAYHKKQNKRVHIYTPIGAAKFDVPFYQVYQMLAINFNTNNTNIKNPTDGVKNVEQQQNRIPSTLVQFLVKVIKTLRIQGIKQEAQIKQQIFGKQIKKEVNQQQATLNKKRQKKIEQIFKAALNSVNKSDQQIKKQYEGSLSLKEQHLVWFQLDNLFNKFEILSQKIKKERIQKLSTNLKGLWNFKLVHVRKDPQLRSKFGRYVIVSDIGWEKKKNHYKEVRFLSQIIAYEKQHRVNLNIEDRHQRSKKLGQDLIKQIIHFQQAMNIDFVWLNPQNVYYDDIKDEYHLSPFPAIHWALGVSKQPMSLQQKFVFYTPKGPDLYAAPEMLMQKPQTSRTTACWQLLLLLDQYNRLRHLFQGQGIKNQQDLMQQQRHFEKDYKQANCRTRGQKIVMNPFAILIQQTKRTLLKKQPNKHVEWYDHKKRPQLQDFQHFFTTKKGTNSKTQKRMVEVFEVLNDQYKKLLQMLKNSQFLTPIKRQIIQSWIKLIRWTHVRSIIRLTEAEQGEYFIQLSSRMRQQKINIQQDLAKHSLKLDSFKLGKITGQVSQKNEQQLNSAKHAAIESFNRLYMTILDNDEDIQQNYGEILNNLETYFEEDCLNKQLAQININADYETLQSVMKFDLNIIILARTDQSNYSLITNKKERIQRLRDKSCSTSNDQMLNRTFQELKKQFRQQKKRIIPIKARQEYQVAKN